MRSPAVHPPGAGLLIVTIDRLPAWMLPAWGATWVSMPAVDAAAARGVVFDRLLATTLDPLQTLAALAADGALWREAAAAGWAAAIVSDKPSLPATPAGVQRFDVPALPAPDTAQRDDDTNAARLCDQARAVIEARGHRLVWCHLSGLGVAWDAPRQYREAYADPEDPPPPPGATVPHRTVTAETDPDLVVGLRQAFAGQLTLLDRCLAPVLAAAESAGWSICLAGLRGMPLGLHGVVGCAAENPPGGLPYGEWIHVPAVLVDAAGRMAGQRYGGLAVPADLGATLVELVGGHAAVVAGAKSLAGLLESWSAPVRDRVIVAVGDAAAAITPGWHLVATRPAGAASMPPRLFAKPDDCFEQSDVADRCPAVAEELMGILASVWHGDIAAAEARPLSPAAAASA